jgi:hypothetical protein
MEKRGIVDATTPDSEACLSKQANERPAEKIAKLDNDVTKTLGQQFTNKLKETQRKSG